MNPICKIPPFWRLVLGLCFFGLGQRLFLTGVLSSWATDTTLSFFLPLLSLVFLLVALFLILPIGIRFYKEYRFDKRLIKIIELYFLSILVCGLVVGIIGEVLYDYTSFSYIGVKTGSWFVTTIIQNILKVILCFGLVSIYQRLPIISRKKNLLQPIVWSSLLSLISCLLALWLPAIASVLLSAVDTLIFVAVSYYFIYIQKENEDEKAS